MSIHLVTARRDKPVTPDDLALLLRVAAGGDTDAFARFTDATANVAFRLELTRAARRRPALRTIRPGELVEQAGRATRRRYLEAWARCGEHAASGLSPLAWLLALPTADRASR